MPIQENPNRNTLYGVHVMKAPSAMMPKELPHMAHVAVRVFDSRDEAERYAAQMANKKGLRVTDQLVGPNGTRCVVPGVAVHYTLSVDDKTLEAFKAAKEADKPFEMYIDEQEHVYTACRVHFYEDALHHPGDFSPMEIREEMTNRWYDFQHMDRALQKTSPEVLKSIDLSNAEVRENLRMVYGSTGLINQEFFTPYFTEDLLRGIQKTVSSGDYGIGYALCMKDMDTQYHNAYYQARSEGHDNTYAISAAGLAACEVLRTQAQAFGDVAMLTQFVEPTIAVCLQGIESVKDVVQNDISEDDPEIFE